jgi:glycosyltransferase involved in cell wall biosynthesis
MKILIVYTDPNVILKDTGAKARLVKLFKLFSWRGDLFFLGPSRTKQDKARYANDNVSTIDTYYFRQWSVGEKYLAIFTDFNFSYLLRLKRIIKKEKIDLVFITLPYGVISASFICRDIPLIYGAEFVISGTSTRLVSSHIGRSFAIFGYPFIGRLIGSITLGYLSLLERMACKGASHIIAISELDRQRLIEHHGIGCNKITVIPHHINSDEFKGVALEGRKRYGERATVTVLFHGSYTDHPANYEAFKRILDYIAPEVEKCNSNIQFLLAGTDVPVFQRGNVKSLGFVEDLSSLLRSADIAIVPFLRGAGVKIKIFDYMAAGLPIIITKNGIEGIDAEDGKHAIIVDTVDQKFINAILDLASDSKKREMIGRNALELVKTRYSEESMQAKVDEMLTKLKRYK